MNNNSDQKEEVRASLPPSNLTPDKYGKVAEQVRRSRYYAEARQIFVDPGPELLQVRINAILDQKELILPSGGLKQGFVHFKPNIVPFNKLAHALTFKGISEFGEIIPSSMLASLAIDFVVVASDAIDGSGGRLGDGLGFTDITLALFREYGALKNSCKIVSFIPENRVLAETLPLDPWDVRLDGYVTESDTKYFLTPPAAAKIIWSALPKKRIRKIQPLWDLFCEKNPLPSGAQPTG